MTTSANTETYPSRVFKYLIPQRIDVLESLTIRFTQPSGTNDLFELVPVFGQVLPDEMLEKEFDLSSDRMKAQLATSLRQEYDKRPRAVKRRVSFQQFLDLIDANPQLVKDGFEQVKPSITAANRSITPIIKLIIADRLSKIGILSLSSSVTNPTMWAYYAEDGTGFACEFDTSHVFFDRRRSLQDDCFI